MPERGDWTRSIASCSTAVAAEASRVAAPVLAGPRVALCPLRDEDSPILHRWINDRALVVLSAPYRPVSEEEHGDWFERIRRRVDTVIFGIRLRETDELIGSCQLHAIHPVHRSAELQIRLGEASARGRGLGSEATGLLLEYAFAHLDLHRVYLHVFAGNLAARRMYAKAGFREEGRLSEAARIEGAWVDVVSMAKLRSDHVGSSSERP
jgi:RimJ/RimL family protein N-acetyltransferase